MAKDRNQIMKELEDLKTQVHNLQSTNAGPREGGAVIEEGVPALMKYMIEERERTNRKLEELSSKINRLKLAVETIYKDDVESEPMRGVENREIPLSGLDGQILDFVQSQQMVCADQIKEFMKYKGRNAACTRLNRLYNMGLLERYQLGHKVYYKYAGKATNTLIISPPQ